MQRMIGPNGWEQLTALKEQLTPQDKSKIKELSAKEDFTGLTEFIEKKLYELVEKKCKADSKASNKLYKFDAEKDGEALKDFFDETAFFPKMKEFFVRIKTDKNEVIKLQTFINQLSLEQIQELQSLKPTGVYPPIFGLLWVLKYIATGALNFFIKLANGVSFGKWNLNTLTYPEGYDKTFNDYKSKLSEFSTDTPIKFLDDEKVKNAMLLIPEVEDEKPSNFLTGVMDKFKGSMLPDSRKLQKNWQKALFVLLMAAALTAIIMFPYILGPLAGFVAGATITAIFAKVSIAYTLTKIAAFILDPIIVRVFETSDDLNCKQVLSYNNKDLKPEDKPITPCPNSIDKLCKALPSGGRSVPTDPNAKVSSSLVGGVNNKSNGEENVSCNKGRRFKPNH